MSFRNTVQILGVKVSSLNKKQVKELLLSFLDSPNQHYVVTPNPEFLVGAQKDQEFFEILNAANLSTCDGVGLQYAAVFLGHAPPPRFTGNDLMQTLAGLCAEKGKSMYLLGGKDRVADKAADILKGQYPTLKIRSSAGGDIGIKDRQWQMEREVLLDIREFEPDVLFVALGHGKQERWIISFQEFLPSVKIAAGIGGAFDYLSGSVPRAPFVLRKLGLEWLHRLFKEPRRFKRIWTAVMVFPFLVVWSKIRPRKKVESDRLKV
jgi:N-acetylglucosaminyldiphosphoundecaprenol N-acetyl-beta-D-mannosaminyltransferase